ncbi:MAG TPA: hypothetical protein VGN06_05965 [Gaiellaceae bacterium]
MRRLLTWIAGAAGGLAAYKAATRRTAEPEPIAAEADPAEELRARLAQAKAEEPEPQGPDARRRDVHEQARSAIDEMRDKT